MAEASPDFLRNTELFAHVPSNVWPKLAPEFVPRKVRAQTPLFEQGSTGTHVFAIKSGLVELRRRDEVTGMEYLVRRLKEGDTCGEEGVLLDDPLPFGAVVTRDAEVLCLKKSAFRHALERLPHVGIAASRLLSRRMMEAVTQKGIRFVALSKVQPQPEVFTELPKKVITEHKAVPIERHGTTITVAMVNPADLLAQDEINRHLRKYNVDVVGVGESDFAAFLAKQVMPAFAKGDARGQDDKTILPRFQKQDYELEFIDEVADRTADDVNNRQLSGEQTVKLLNEIVGDAAMMAASDIHVEPQERAIVVRYRIDGELWKRAEELPIRVHSALSTRLKAIARMDITERRAPQDGRVSVRINGRELSLRLSTIPTKFGEKIVMRLLDKSVSLQSLDRLITVDRVRDLARSLVNLPYGIVLITGPTGSGKTTTMYSALLERKDQGLNIVTIEDPIEYTIPGINQCQINDAVGLGFAEAIRAFLRQDPDIILVGETRDPRTAANAMQAALSGHLVFTSLHTNDALSSIYRLREMGVEQFLIGNAVGGVISQRLVRRICSECREQVNFPASIVRRIFDNPNEAPKFWRGAGCHHCNQTGYSGRVGVYEVLRVSEELRAAIAAELPMAELKPIAMRTGMVSLADYARFILRLGLTTPDEVLRILYTEDTELEIPEPEPVVKCPECGNDNDPDSRFCHECGTPLES